MWREDADGHYRKDMTAGDTHVTTALGNEKDSKKVSTAYLQDDEDEKKNGKVVQAEDCAPATIKAEFDLKITKLDPDQQKVFGWAYVCQRGDYLVVDKQGDMILPADMETAAHEYALHWRSQGNMHKLDENGTPVPHGRLIESIVFTPEKMDKAGIKATDPRRASRYTAGSLGSRLTIRRYGKRTSAASGQSSASAAAGAGWKYPQNEIGRHLSRR